MIKGLWGDVFARQLDAFEFEAELLRLQSNN